MSAESERDAAALEAIFEAALLRVHTGEYTEDALSPPILAALAAAREEGRRSVMAEFSEAVFEDARIKYVEVQIPRDLWLEAIRARAERKERAE